MLEISNLFYRYHKGHTLLQDISLDVGQGEIVAILGTSGSGKTTLLRLIAGLEQPESGTIKLQGKFASKPRIQIPPEDRQIGMVFQHPSLFPHLNVEQNILFGANKRQTKKNKEQLQKLLAMMQMETSGSSYPHELSGGEQQRIAIARALAANPKLMLLDEPFSNLDVLFRKKIREETLELLTELEITTLIVTHDPEEAFRMAGRIYVMDQGRIIQSGTTESLYNNPASSLVASLFGEIQAIPVELKDKSFRSPIGSFEISKLGIKQEEASQISEIFIRPEGISPIEGKKKAANTRIKAHVRHIRFLGTSTLIYIMLEGSELRLKMRVDPAQECYGLCRTYREGDSIDVQIDQAHLLWFKGKASKA